MPPPSFIVIFFLCYCGCQYVFFSLQLVNGTKLQQKHPLSHQFANGSPQYTKIVYSLSSVCFMCAPFVVIHIHFYGPWKYRGEVSLKSRARMQRLVCGSTYICCQISGRQTNETMIAYGYKLKHTQVVIRVVAEGGKRVICWFDE